MKKVDFKIISFPAGAFSFNKKVLGVRRAYPILSLRDAVTLVRNPLPISLGIVDMPFAEKAQKIMDEYGIKTEFKKTVTNYE